MTNPSICLSFNKIMNKFFAIFLLSLISLTLKATECVDKTFKEKHLNIYVCQNLSNYNETETLLFKARAQILNDYIGEKIKSGVLRNKKIEIQLYDPILTSKHLHISQSEKGYFVSYAGFATIQQLKTFIDYFANPNWKPFFTSDSDERAENNEAISKQIAQFFLDYKTSEIPTARLNVWTLENLRLDYAEDKLGYYINETQLQIKPNASLPIKIQDRFLLFQADSIFVLQEQKIIKTFKIDNPIAGDFDVYTHHNWVNICEGGKENWMYSYSYSKNKFYKR